MDTDVKSLCFCSASANFMKKKWGISPEFGFVANAIGLGVGTYALTQPLYLAAAKIQNTVIGTSIDPEIYASFGMSAGVVGVLLASVGKFVVMDKCFQMGASEAGKYVRKFQAVAYAVPIVAGMALYPGVTSNDCDDAPLRIVSENSRICFQMPNFSELKL